MPRTRTFPDGSKLELFEEFSSKSKAQALAKDFREDGDKARVTTTTRQGKKVYQVWTTPIDTSGGFLGSIATNLNIFDF